MNASFRLALGIASLFAAFVGGTAAAQTTPLPTSATYTASPRPCTYRAPSVGLGSGPEFRVGVLCDGLLRWEPSTGAIVLFEPLSAATLTNASGDLLVSDTTPRKMHHLPSGFGFPFSSTSRILNTNGQVVVWNAG